jgi:predicted nucleic acid-binding protein
VIVLDTNVLSALMRQVPDPTVVAWLDKQPRASIWISAVTVLEVRFGLHILPAGRRRAALTQAFEKLLGETIEARIAPFDDDAATRAGDVMAARHRKGTPGDLRDTMLAGIVLAHRATLATRNTRHFDDLAIRIVDPWHSAS